jgi:hypothetical protein
LERERRRRWASPVLLALVGLIVVLGAVAGVRGVARGRRAAAYVGRWHEAGFVHGGRIVTADELRAKMSPRARTAMGREFGSQTLDVRADGSCVQSLPPTAAAFAGVDAFTLRWRLDRRGNLVAFTDPRDPSSQMVYSLSRDGRTLLFNPDRPADGSAGPRDGDMLFERAAGAGPGP